jgi:hypothetical protein
MEAIDVHLHSLDKRFKSDSWDSIQPSRWRRLPVDGQRLTPASLLASAGFY